jgi:uncharacterized protein involved in outer membrane biogenesis
LTNQGGSGKQVDPNSSVRTSQIDSSKTPSAENIDFTKINFDNMDAQLKEKLSEKINFTTMDQGMIEGLTKEIDFDKVPEDTMDSFK